jgi:hypothetical protein
MLGKPSIDVGQVRVHTFPHSSIDRRADLLGHASMMRRYPAVHIVMITERDYGNS